MNLIISLSNPDILPESLRTRRVEFGTSGGLIGRKDECDWVLDDPERFVSSRHLRILFKGDGFFAEDISTNGTYLNEELIGKGNKVPLVTGDVLRLGRFILAVEQRDDSGSVIGDMGAAAAPVDLLAETGHGLLGGSDAPVKTDDLLASPGETEEIDAFIGDSFVASDEADDSLLSDFAPMPAVQDALPVMRQDEASEAVPSDWMTRDASADDMPSPSAAKTAPSDDLLGGGSEPAGEMDDYGLTPVPPKDTPELSEPAPKPKAKKAAPKKTPAKKKATPKKTAPKTLVEEAPVAEKAAEKKAKKKTEKKAEKKKPAKSKKKKTAAASAAPVAAATAAFVAPAAEAAEEAFTPPAPKAARPAPVAPVYDAPLPEDFGTAIASSLLLNPSQATAETGDVLGRVLRELIEGSLDLMETRNQMRQELRLSGTMVGARENNPLKFSINYQDALGRMLQGEAMGFKPPVDSAVEVIDDLKRHQLGVFAGIDAGVKALLNALDPKQLGGKSKIAGLSMTNKMAEQHARIKEDTVERSDGVFWRAFAEAYKMAVSSSYDR